MLPPFCRRISVGNILSLTIAGFSLFAGKAAAQGCIASRCAAGVSHADESMLAYDAEAHARWQVTVGYRWFKSDRQFTGSHEDDAINDEGGQDINDSHFVDFGVSYQWTPRFSLSLTVPFVEHDRSSVVRNRQGAIVERYHVQANGPGDLRLSGSYWLFDPVPRAQGKEPAVPRRGNILLSAGIDMPTGKDDVKDVHRRFNPAVNRPLDMIREVDQSIQPGDGGWGIPLDLYAYYRFTDRLSGYLTASYQITPEESNGVLTGIGNEFERYMSIPDTFSGRIGLDYALLPQHGVTVSLGLRAEGVPTYDLVGGSDDFRRPGIAVSVEPGVSFMKNNWSASLTVPIAIYRDRYQSVPDKQLSAVLGTNRHGEASFADYLILFSVGKRF